MARFGLAETSALSVIPFTKNLPGLSRQLSACVITLPARSDR
jgi:hypothetical protein